MPLRYNLFTQYVMRIDYVFLYIFLNYYVPRTRSLDDY